MDPAIYRGTSVAYRPAYIDFFLGYPVTPRSFQGPSVPRMYFLTRSRAQLFTNFSRSCNFRVHGVPSFDRLARVRDDDTQDPDPLWERHILASPDGFIPVAIIAKFDVGRVFSGFDSILSNHTSVNHGCSTVTGRAS